MALFIFEGVEYNTANTPQVILEKMKKAREKKDAENIAIENIVEPLKKDKKKVIWEVEREPEIIN